MQMPGLNGYEATQQIRQFNKDVIITVSFGLSDDREKGNSSRLQRLYFKINKSVHINT
jgi:CheY-like chemotaxis protein